MRVIEEGDERVQRVKTDRGRGSQGDRFSGVAGDQRRGGRPVVGEWVCGVESGRRWRRGEGSADGGLARGPDKYFGDMII